ncbi:serine/threonine-protein kinase [Okeania sp. SIO1I7]|uniref:serine/threonine-protein kinase n=1 Tax=Okeania sp. SIO1I7 TaxID=2607772 RepID=UPI0013FB2401|nr:serine/threonine-protein kinase [Okeania sp. SIO1I7]NET30014.1 protein kinase [Okeania sp. SIO1I7]
MNNICPSCLHENTPDVNSCIVCGTALTPTPTTSSPSVSGLHLPTGTLLKQGYYKIEQVLGQGGFGITYKAIYCPNSALVAIKELWPESGYRQGKSILWPSSIAPIDRKEQIEKFKLEAAYLQRCNSPNIAKVYDCFEENSSIYMVMEFIDGVPLSNLVTNQNPLQENKVIEYVKQIANALVVVHQNKLLHRDIKPENIMIDSSDRAVLIDFGTAREFIAGKTGDLTMLLTPGYAPFEQYSKSSKRYAASDIYALCASMYELLTRELPSGAVERATAFSGGASDPLIPPRQINSLISPHIERVILMGMRFRVEERIQSADELINALDGKLVSPLHQKAKDYVSKGDLINAVSTYETFLEQEPDNGEATVELALVLVYIDGERAATVAQKAMQLKPQDGRSYGVCGLVSCHRNQWNNAVQQLRQGIRLSPKEAWMHANLAWALGQQGNWESADGTIQQALRLDANSTFALGLQAWISFHRKQWRFVVRAGTQAIFKSQQEQSQMAMALRAWVYPFTIAALEKVTTKKGSDVERRLQKFVTQVPNNAVALGLQAWYEFRHHNLTACRQSLELACQCEDVPDWVARDRGLIDEHLNDLTSAVQWYEYRQQQTPGDAWVCYRLGTVLARLNQWQDAKVYLEQAVKQDQNLAPAYRNLGLVLSNLRTVDGNIESVQDLLAAYRQALALYEVQNQNEAQQIRAMFQAIDILL